ncbi:MAG: 50S ribosomal protein L11 methyltransferase [Gammaproteobacteria bacterium]|nr:50S ribosomal protein L11 methyltransferase [Gammaproteobacteria bacterium]
MSWKQLSLEIDRLQAEQASDMLSELGAVSVSYEDAGDHPLYQIGTDDVGLWEQVRVIGLFESGIDVNAIESVLSSQLQGIRTWNWHNEQLQDQVWELVWQDHFQPMRFGQRLWVCPPEAVVSEPDSVVIRMQPGLAFGTGTHPTTALCLEWLDTRNLVGKSVIDYGCGSGILAIASALLGCDSVTAVDIDPCAVETTQENADNNSVSNAVLSCSVETMNDAQADIVIANILANPLIELRQTLTDLVADQGCLVLSGILHHQADSIIDAYQSDFRFGETNEKEGWVRLAGVKF